MPLYMCQPPTGYKDTADAWANTGALVGHSEQPGLGSVGTTSLDVRAGDRVKFFAARA